MPPPRNNPYSVLKDQHPDASLEGTEYNALILATSFSRTRARASDKKDNDAVREAMTEQFQVAVKASQPKNNQELQAAIYAVGEKKHVYTMNNNYKELLKMKHDHASRQILSEV